VGGGGVISKPLEAMARPSKDDVERLSRGQATRAKIGSRRIGHRLTRKERALFDAARRRGFLKIPVSGIRPNVVNVYRLWCAAEGRDFLTATEEAPLAD
jgi:hypothetical protein